MHRFLLGMLMAASGVLATGPILADEPGLRGKLVLFGVHREGKPGTAIVAMNPDGSGLTLLHELDEPGRSISMGRISPDSQRLAFTIFDDKTRKGEVWVQDSQGTRRKICEDANIRGWSPDGTSLACVSGRLGAWTSFVVNVKTSERRSLPIAEVDMVDDWAPGGFLVMRGRPDEMIHHPTKGEYPLRHIDLLSEKGGRTRSIGDVPLHDHLFGRISPDGKSLSHYTRVIRDDLPIESSMIRSVDGGSAVTALAFNQLDESFRPKAEGRLYWDQSSAAAWSPDGFALAWLVDNGKSPEANKDMNEFRFAIVVTSRTGEFDHAIDLRKLGVIFVSEIDWGR